MNKNQKLLNKEAIESALKEIHYYSNLPKHIKGRVSELKDIKPNTLNENPMPAHVVAGAVTVIMGKLNIPTLTRSKSFLKKSVFNYKAKP